MAITIKYINPDEVGSAPKGVTFGSGTPGQSGTDSYIFFGTPIHAVYTLDALVSAGHPLPALVVCSPDKPIGRHRVLTAPPAKAWATEHGIPVYQPEKITPEAVEHIVSIGASYGIVAAYGLIMPASLIDQIPNGIFCVHPSLLPAYRGPAPIESALLNNEPVTGVSIMMLDPLVDHGPIVAVEKYVVSPTDTRITLTEKLFTLGGTMCADVIPKYLDNKISSVDQEHDKATFTKKIKKEDGLVHLSDDGQTLWNKYRAYTGMMGIYFFTLPHVPPPGLSLAKGEEKLNTPKRIKITEASFIDGVFEIKKVIPEGKHEMTFEDFKRGHTI